MKRRKRKKSGLLGRGQRPCMCYSGKAYEECCKPYHKGEAVPAEPEALMRARFCAYALGLADYIMETTHPEGPHWEEDVKEWRTSIFSFSNATDFAGLTVVDAEVDEDEDLGWVTFEADLRQLGEFVPMQERSLFERVDGRWLYVQAD